MIYKNEPKNLVPKLETILPGTVYAFTLSPEVQYFEDVERVYKMNNLMKNRLRSPNISYKLYLEISPLGRIHYHGWLWIENPYEFMRDDINKLISSATVCIKPIDDPMKWEDYCTKQSHIFDLKYNDIVQKRFLPIQSHDKIQTKIDDYVAKGRGSGTVGSLSVKVKLR